MSTPTIILNPDDEREPGTVLWDSGLDLPIEADIPFNSMLAGSGWYPAEFFEGVYFRWMGAAATARVAVVVDRSIDLELSFYVPHIVDHECWGEVAFHVDGQPVAAVLAVEEVRRFVIQMPARHSHFADEPRQAQLGAPHSVTEIEVCAPFTKQSNPADARTFSIGVSLLRIRPISPEILKRNRLVVRSALLSYFAGRDMTDLMAIARTPGGAP